MRKALALVFLFVACGDETVPPDGAVPPDEAADALGALAVGHTTFEVVDASREDRTLRVEVWYPAIADDEAEPTIYDLLFGAGPTSEVAREDAPPAAGPRPLLVFSHGYGGIALQSTGLMEALASHGFVVASPEHTGNAQSSPTDDFDTAAGNRVPDVSLVIDRMRARSARAGDLLEGILDAGGVGVLGHSFGGMTAMGSAAGWAGAAPDPRVTAIAPISAVIDGDLQRDDRPSANAGFTDAQLASVRVPVLLVGGTEDVAVPIENNAIAFRGLTNAEAAFRVDIVGANHTHFATVCVIANYLIEVLGFEPDRWDLLGAEALRDPFDATCSEDAFPIAEATRLQNLYAIAFFRRYLRGETAYDYYLDANYAASEPDVRFEAR
ncbi:MAG: alpha/beta fold hydrolase [Myxococcota bacterium]